MFGHLAAWFDWLWVELPEDELLDGVVEVDPLLAALAIAAPPPIAPAAARTARPNRS